MRFRRIAAGLTAVLLTALTCVLFTGSPAQATTRTFKIAWTKIGIYPRSSPSMSATKVGSALRDGTSITVDCEKTGTSVTSVAGTSSIWEHRTNGTWIPNSYVNTGVDGWTPGLPRCGSSTPYRLPFKKGTRFQITQGPAQHAAGLYPDYNRHAIDFAMPVGTRVLASRGGRIYFEGYDSTGAIQIRIDHGGNSCTQYVHLSRSIVNRSQTVSRGQLIGYSGRTGIVSGPHLHWNKVYCDSAKSRGVVNTREMGTRYPVGLSRYSQNG